MSGREFKEWLDSAELKVRHVEQATGVSQSKVYHFIRTNKANETIRNALARFVRDHSKLSGGSAA